VLAVRGGGAVWSLSRPKPPLVSVLPASLVRSNLCAIHAKRVTIMPKDIQLARRIRGERA
jgi:hypothetical protein